MLVPDQTWWRAQPRLLTVVRAADGGGTGAMRERHLRLHTQLHVAAAAVQYVTLRQRVVSAKICYYREQTDCLELESIAPGCHART